MECFVPSANLRREVIAMNSNQHSVPVTTQRASQALLHLLVLSFRVAVILFSGTQMLSWNLAFGTPQGEDWLVDPSSYKATAEVSADGKSIRLANGLIERRFVLAPNVATIGFTNLITGESILRGVKPEATVSIDGKKYSVGGLVGQPNYAFLDPSWISKLSNDPLAFQFKSYEIRPQLQERFPWKRTRHHAPGVHWPPKGIELVLSFSMPNANWKHDNSSDIGRVLRWSDSLSTLDSQWTTLKANSNKDASADRSSEQAAQLPAANSIVANQGAGSVFSTMPGQSLLLERAMPENSACVEVLIDPGTDLDTSWGPGLALVWDDGNVEVNLRSGDRGEHGHFELRNRGREQLAKVSQFAASDSGLELDRVYALRVRWQSGSMIWDAAQLPKNALGNEKGENAPRVYHKLFEIPWDSRPPLALRIGKSDRSGNATDAQGPSKQLPSKQVLSNKDGDEQATVAQSTHCVFGQIAAYGPFDESLLDNSVSSGVSSGVSIDVHYELYDGLPAYSKWVSITNPTNQQVEIDHYCSDILAAVEHTSEVDSLSVGLTPPNLHIETEMAFGGMTSQGANRRSYRWVADPDYHTQVNYEKKTPCLLEVGPDIGPSQRIEPGKQWNSFRGWVLVQDSFDRERSGLAIRKLFRCIAPWVTENPLMMHLIASDDASVMRAIDQCHEVGFEMLILSFGSGFNLENRNPATIEKAQRFAQAAKAKEIEIGSYSLLASRSVSPKDDVVMRDGEKPAFGNSPCLESQWGMDYFSRLYEFHRASGFTLLEHDGSYPGDPCNSESHPGHRSYEDSRWNQWESISDLYRWGREQGFYLNVPDHYFLVGSNKTGMGYREVNWSLPREQQTIHTRQNIYDGTWQKIPSMGWMFVPLTEYHGGGPKATIEPLDENIAHYQNMIQSNLALGVQACYRGPRLFDTDRVKEMVKSEVAWYKKYRDILESDIIHGRRPDAVQLDWYLHANPGLQTQGMLVVFNPTDAPLKETLRVPTHYTGLREQARVQETRGQGPAGADWVQLPISPKEILEIEVVVPPFSMRSFAMEKTISSPTPSAR